MSKKIAERETRSDRQTAQQPEPAFKPVALPAVAAAVHVAGLQPNRPKKHELPAILRKEAMTD
ncbi:hypothetical protein [Microvirga sp. 2TAF3]|uniref:hypothetical protein n=1 Tax=Microvirga sp. 2TAF3 TaxID=3233014 RepID=UPI003F9B9AC4